MPDANEKWLPLGASYVLTVRVDESTLPTRAKNVLKRLEAVTIADVVKLTPEQVLRAKWAGKKVLSYIETWLREFGLSLTIPQAVKPSPAGFPLLNSYTETQGRLFEYFGYVQDWVSIPVQDNTDDHWLLLEGKNGRGVVTFAGEELTPELLNHETPGCFYGYSIYTQRFLPKWVYRAQDYTMIVVDTHTDGNKYLAIFANAKEATPATHGARYEPLVEAAKTWDLYGDIGNSVLATEAHKLYPETTKFEPCETCGEPARSRCDGKWRCEKHVEKSKEYIYRQ
jgi:hypothetical protein